MIRSTIVDTTRGVYGHVDSINEQGISGWILDLDGGVNVVEVYINDVKVAEKEANLPRPDIDSIVGRETNCGFLVPWREVKLREIGGKFGIYILHKRSGLVLPLAGQGKLTQNVKPTNKTYLSKAVVDKIEPIKPNIIGQSVGVFGYIDSVNEEGIIGWIYDFDNEPPYEVSVYVNDKLVARKHTHLPRQDIGSIVGRVTNCGFHIKPSEIMVGCYQDIFDESWNLKIKYRDREIEMSTNIDVPSLKRIKMFKNPFMDVFSCCKLFEDRALDGLSIGLFVSSKGNIFMDDIARLLLYGFLETGAHVIMLNDSEVARTKHNFDLGVVIAPHEFFTLCDSPDTIENIKRMSKFLILLNVEQPHTAWFVKASKFFDLADAIWDVNYQSAISIKSNGYNTYFIPLTYSQIYEERKYAYKLEKEPTIESFNFQEFQCVPKNFEQRPIDILFVGAISEKRAQFFARYAKFFGECNAFIYLPAPKNPFHSGNPETLKPDMLFQLALRSKIVINIHQGEDAYFEWQRIVQHGVMAKCLVISETCERNPVIIPNLHYIDVPIDSIVETCKYYLTNLGEAAKMAHSAYNSIASMKLSTYLSKLTMCTLQSLRR